jgi:hypothetical protein
MTMRRIAQASASGGEHSIISLVTAALASAVTFSGGRLFFFGGGCFVWTTFFFAFSESEHE